MIGLNFPKRKQNRLEGYNYSEKGAYFITLCVKDKHKILWKPLEARTTESSNLSEYGIIINDAINNISNYYPCIEVDCYVIMPNHIHMILIVNDSSIQVPKVSSIINQMKGYVTKQIGFSLWQKLFYDHIIRNEEEYQSIQEYIKANPIKWENKTFI